MRKSIRLNFAPRETYLVHHGRLHRVHAGTEPASVAATIVTNASRVPIAAARDSLELALHVLPRHPVDGDTITTDGVVAEVKALSVPVASRQWAHWALLNSGRAVLTLTTTDAAHTQVTQDSWVLDHDEAAFAVETLCTAVEAEDLVEALLRVTASGPHPSVAA